MKYCINTNRKDNERYNARAVLYPLVTALSLSDQMYSNHHETMKSCIDQSRWSHGDDRQQTAHDWQPYDKQNWQAAGTTSEAHKDACQVRGVTVTWTVTGLWGYGLERGVVGSGGLSSFTTVDGPSKMHSSDSTYRGAWAHCITTQAWLESANITSSREEDKERQTIEQMGSKDLELVKCSPWQNFEASYACLKAYDTQKCGP